MLFRSAFFVAAARLTGAEEEGGTIASIPRRAVTEAMAFSIATFQFSSRSTIVSRSVIRLQCITDVEFGVLSQIGTLCHALAARGCGSIQPVRTRTALVYGICPHCGYGCQRRDPTVQSPSESKVCLPIYLPIQAKQGELGGPRLIVSH